MTNNFLMKSIRVVALAAVTLLPAMACTYSASSAAVGAGGGNTSVQIYTQSGCAWEVTAGASWLEIFSARSGSGNGTVYVYLPPNRGGTRQAYLNVVAFEPAAAGIPGRSGVPSSVIVFRSLVTEY